MKGRDQLSPHLRLNIVGMDKMQEKSLDAFWMWDKEDFRWEIRFVIDLSIENQGEIIFKLAIYSRTRLKY